VRPAVAQRFRRRLKRATRRSLATPRRSRLGRRLRRCCTSQSARRISTCARCRAPRNGVAKRSSRAPILGRAGAHGAVQAPFAGYLALGSKRAAAVRGTSSMKDLVRRRAAHRGVRPDSVVPVLEARPREEQKALWWRGTSSCASPSSLRVRMNRLCRAAHKRFYAKLAIMRSMPPSLSNSPTGQSWARMRPGSA
jgi:hypothetical protein